MKFNHFFLFYKFFFFLKTDVLNFCFDHLQVSNFLLNLIIITLFLIFFILTVFTLFKNSNFNCNFDYFISLFNLVVFISILFFTHNMYSFIFILEINSLLIFYKFSVSRYFFKDEKKLFLDKSTPTQYINMLFFQYWANFFSSILIFFSIFNVNFLFGSLNWFFLNFLMKINLNIMIFNLNVFYYLWAVFFLGFFLKIGLTPLHLFKIEVYKGLPFFSIFFYTTYYFFCFFLFFFILAFIYLNQNKFLIYITFMVFVIVGGLYVIFLLFDANLIKIFFAYSTVINVLNFIILLLVF